MYGLGGRIRCATIQTLEAPRRKRDKPVPKVSVKRARRPKAGDKIDCEKPGCGFCNPRQSSSTDAQPAPPQQPAEAVGATEPDDMIHCAYCGPQRGVDMGDGWLRCGGCGTL